MHWIAPSEKDTNNAAQGKRLWSAGSKCEVQCVRHLRRLPAEVRFDYLLNVTEILKI